MAFINSALRKIDWCLREQVKAVESSDDLDTQISKLKDSQDAVHNQVRLELDRAVLNGYVKGVAAMVTSPEIDVVDKACHSLKLFGIKKENNARYGGADDIDVDELSEAFDQIESWTSNDTMSSLE